MRQTQRRAARLVAVAATVTLTALAGQPAAAHSHDEEPPVTPVDPREAVADDVALIAAKTGWSLAGTAQHMRVQETLSNLLAALAGKHPQTYAGGALAEQPGEASVIRFKGEVPADAVEAVAAAGIPVDLRGGATYSAAELRDRTMAVVSYLTGAGYDEVVGAVMPAGLIEVTVGGGPATDPVLPPALRPGARITTIAGPAVRLEHARGGAWLEDGIVDMCTSGFTVENIFTGVTGVTTAAHCPDGLEYDPPDGTADFGLTLQGQHEGFFGDIQWHTSTHVEPNEFYADTPYSTNLRTVTAVEPYAGIAANNWYCVYGKASNNRECDDVYSAFVSAGGVSHLVAMSNDNTVNGDSGGTWSFGTEATGGHRGDKWIWFSWRNVFSVAALYPVVFPGVVVRT